MREGGEGVWSEGKVCGVREGGEGLWSEGGEGLWSEGGERCVK